ncbi:MAG: AMP-binding protein [Myxococcota bacterium]
MLIDALAAHADAALLVSSHAGTVTRGEVRERALEIAENCGSAFTGRPVGIRGRATFDNVAWLVATVQMGALAVVLPLDGTGDDVEELELAGIVGERPFTVTGQSVPPDAGLVLFNRTGRGLTEANRHEWSDLVERVGPARGVRGARWLLTEPMATFGGIHVLLEAILGRGTVCVPFPAAPRDQLDAAAAAGVTHVSGTPAFFRFALATHAPGRRDWTPRQITVGGGPVPPDLIDDLREHFPQTRLTHLRERRAFLTRPELRW